MVQSKQALHCISLPSKGNHCQCCVALHNYPQQMISWFLFRNHSADSVTQLFFVVPPTVQWGYNSRFAHIKVKNRLRKPYWFLCCWDPFTESVEGEMNWYKANKTRSAVFGQQLNDTQICWVRAKFTGFFHLLLSIEFNFAINSLV